MWVREPSGNVARRSANSSSPVAFRLGFGEFSFIYNLQIYIVLSLYRMMYAVGIDTSYLNHALLLIAVISKSGICDLAQRTPGRGTGWMAHKSKRQPRNRIEELCQWDSSRRCRCSCGLLFTLE